MHDIEPYYRWRTEYQSERDDKSPFFGRTYNEFSYQNKVYNYYIHPQWDEFGSATLYMKLLYVDYAEGYAMIELIGEWNDALYNDVMYLKREVVDHLQRYDIHKFILFCSNVLNYHGDDDSYYEEWAEEVHEEGGYVCLINALDHVVREMEGTRLQYHMHFGEHYNEVAWRGKKPQLVYAAIEHLIFGATKQLSF